LDKQTPHLHALGEWCIFAKKEILHCIQDDNAARGEL
jgi:hypothetical protein